MSLSPIAASYLFRIDGAKDNDVFFNALRPSVSNIYAGLDLQLGSKGWVPDFVKIIVGDSWRHFSLTIIELEATDSVALISCRKYLPEQPTAIIQSFCEYLSRVIRQCRSTADSRKEEFERLKASLLAAKQVTITTAGALRSSIDFVEELALINQLQPEVVPFPSTRTNPDVKNRTFRGIVLLSADEAKALGRTILVLDAVVRKCDHSAATFKTWRAQHRSQPLKYLLKKSDGTHHFIRDFLFRASNRGITLDIETVLSDLTNIWSEAEAELINLEHVRALVETYYPVAFEIKAHEFMPAIFEAARNHLKERERSGE